MIERDLFLTCRPMDSVCISVYALTDGTGYILVSDQGASRVQIFPREGEPGRPHSHPCLKVVRLRATDSDGSDTTSAALGPLFPGGLFVAMSNDRTYHFYSWKDLAGTDLAVAPDGVRAGLR